ncbi:MAG: hypothetical protein H6577_14160 [Lewinellaceae bacterium]|nr:hypothetical protein [Saprospiraceae bacterium]MCB9339272.1 hypothetical protein [Lewinellaceae bacterium]
MKKSDLCLLGLALSIIGICTIGCYSFQGISIPPDVNTFYVSLFEPQVDDAPPTLPRDFTELMKDKIRRETRLTYADVDPDIEFSGAITRFEVTSEAPKADQQIGFNKLTIAMNVNFVNHKNEKANWKQQFSFEDFFEPNQNLLDVQERLVDNITKELSDRIFNKAFTNW